VKVAGARPLAAALKAAQPSLREVVLMGHRFGDEESAETLLSGLSGSQALHELDLTNSSLGTEGARALAQHIRGCTSMRVLKLEDCELGGEGCEAVAEAIMGMSSLEHLDLRNNDMDESDTCVDVLAESLKGKSKLKMVALDDDLELEPLRHVLANNGVEQALHLGDYEDLTDESEDDEEVEVKQVIDGPACASSDPAGTESPSQNSRCSPQSPCDSEPTATCVPTSPTDAASQHDKLLSAARSGRGDDGIREALSAGADPNASDTEGNTALHHLAQAGRVRATEELLRAKAAPDATNARGVTPLMAASKSGWHELVDVLLKAGADIRIRSIDGRIAADIAAAAARDSGDEASSRYEQTLKLLRAPKPSHDVGSSDVDSAATPQPPLGGTPGFLFAQVDAPSPAVSASAPPATAMSLSVLQNMIEGVFRTLLSSVNTKLSNIEEQTSAIAGVPALQGTSLDAVIRELQTVTESSARQIEELESQRKRCEADGQAAAAAIAVAKAEAVEREKLHVIRENALDSRERLLVKREEACDDREARIRSREDALGRMEEAVRQRQQTMDANEELLKNATRSAQDHAAALHEEVLRSSARIEEVEQANLELQARANALEQQISERTTEIFHLQADNRRLAMRIAGRGSENSPQGRNAGAPPSPQRTGMRCSGRLGATSHTPSSAKAGATSCRPGLSFGAEARDMLDALPSSETTQTRLTAARLFGVLDRQGT